MAEAKHTRYTTPVGIFLFPRLTRPDTKFDPAGRYSCKIAVPVEQSKELVDLINLEVEKQAKENPIKKGDKIEYANLPHVEEIVGGVKCCVFYCKQKARVELKDGHVFEPKIALFDAHKSVLDPNEIDPWTGTQGRLNVELVPYSAALTGVGVTLRLKAAQILELVQGGGGSAESYGFEAVVPEEYDGELPF